jgi:iron donor protein CyaY
MGEDHNFQLDREEQEFTKIAKQELEHLFDIFDSEDIEEDLDLDFSGEVLKITSSRGQHVINRNIAAKEIWLSSPISGPHHFGLKNGKWKTTNGLEMYEILNQEFITNSLI